MSRPTCVLVFVALVTFLAQAVYAQEDPEDYPPLGELDGPYSALAEDPNLDFVQQWSQQRLNIVSELDNQIRDHGSSLKIENLDYDKMLRTYVGVNAAVERSWLSRPNRIFQLFDPESFESRRVLALEMSFVEKTDQWFMKRFNPGDSSTATLSFWAGTRARFIRDLQAKGSAEKQQRSSRSSSFRVVAETFRYGTVQPVRGKEVLYALELWEDYPSAYKPFPMFSTPTNDDLFPGTYVFFCRDEVGEGRRRTVRIDADSTVSLFAPK